MKLRAAQLVMWFVGYLVIGSIGAPPAFALEACTNQVILPFPTGDQHPLRPNPGQVCTPTVDTTARLSCGTDLVAYKTIEVERGGPNCTTTDPLGPYLGGATCEGVFTETVPIEIGLQNLELPIAGVASNVQVADTISDSMKMRNYTSWYLQGATEQADEELLDVTKPETLDRMLNFSGFIKKTISEDVLNERRKQLIDLAVQGQTYNQIIGYVRNSVVIGRKEALELFSQNPGRGDIEKIRLSDMVNSPGFPEPPAYDPNNPDQIKWYTLWRQVPWVQTVNLAGEVFTTIGSSDPARQDFLGDPNKEWKLTLDPATTLADLRVGLPHLLEDDQLAQIMQSVFIPSGVDLTDPDHKDETTVTGNAPPAGYDLSSVNRENPWPWSGTYCRPENLLTPWNPGDNLGSTTTIRGNFRFTKRIQYSYPALTKDERDEYDLNGTLPKVELELSAPVSIFTRTPQPLHDLYDRLVGGPGSIYKALVPEMLTPTPIEDWPTAAGMTFDCGDDCEARAGNEAGRTPHLFFPHLGSILTYFHDKIQCMLDPLGRCGTGGFSGAGTPLLCTLPMTSCAPVDWNDPTITAYENAYNLDDNNSWTLVKEPWAQQMINDTATDLVTPMCPRFVATLWLEESGGSALADYDLGCIWTIDGVRQSTTRHRGGPPRPGKTSQFHSYEEFRDYHSEKLRNQISCLESYINAIGNDFRTFMCQYSGEADIDPNKGYRQCQLFTQNSNFPTNMCLIGNWMGISNPVPPP